MQYIKLFSKSVSKFFLLLTGIFALFCSVADFFVAKAAGTALLYITGEKNDFFFVFSVSLIFWILAQGLFYVFANECAKHTVYNLKRRVLEWFLLKNGDEKEAKALCSFGITRQIWFFMHRYLSVWMRVITLFLCVLFLIASEPVTSLIFIFFCAVYLIVSFYMSQIAMKKQRTYAMAYTEEMGMQYELLCDADGVRLRGKERHLVSRLIKLWRRFRKEEISLYYVFSVTRLVPVVLTALFVCLSCLGCFYGFISQKNLGIMLYASLLLLLPLRHVFRKGPWIQKNKEMCTHLLQIVCGEVAE